MSKDKLSPEEEAFFSSGGEAELPADYAPDAGADPAEPHPEPTAEGAEAAGVAEPETQAVEPAEGVQPPTEDQAKKNVESVPLAVFLEEKKQRQSMERQVAELNQNFGRATQRLEAMMAAQQERAKAAEPAKPAIPDPETDFMGAAKYAFDRVRQLDERDAQTEQQRQEQARQREVQDRVIRTYGGLVEERKQADPTFEDAQNHLINSRYAEYRADGADHETALGMVHREEFMLAAQSLQKGINPADRIVALAKARGWQPKAPEPVQPAEDPAAKLEAIKQGQEASASLSAAGASGAGKSGKVDAKRLGEMTDKEFATWLAQNGEDGFRDAMRA